MPELVVELESAIWAAEANLQAAIAEWQLFAVVTKRAGSSA